MVAPRLLCGRCACRGMGCFVWNTNECHGLARWLQARREKGAVRYDEERDRSEVKLEVLSLEAMACVPGGARLGGTLVDCSAHFRYGTLAVL